MRRAWGAGIALVLLAAGAWILRGEGRRARGTPAPSSAGVAQGSRAAAGEPEASQGEASVAREALPVAQTETRVADGADDEPGPTPEVPAPGQAVLRVRGVASESGAPLAGVTLVLGPLDDPDERHVWHSSTQIDPARGLDNDEVLTDADGRAEFLVDSGFGYVLHGEGERGLARAAELELGSFAPGEVREVVLALDTRWELDWHGRVVDAASGLPLVGARVRAGYADADPLHDFQSIAEVRTGLDGRARLLLPDSEPLLLAEFEDHATGGAIVAFAPTSEESPQEVRLHRLATLSIRVLTHSGEPCAEAEVAVREESWARFDGLILPRDVRSETTTDTEGAAALELPSGIRLRITLAHDGQVFARTFDGEETLELAPGELRRIEWRLPAPAGLRGTLATSRGEPLAGVTLALTASSLPLEAFAPELLEHWTRREDYTAVATALTDARGEFRLEGLPPGCYEFGPFGSDLLPSVALPVLLTSAQTRSLTLTLDPGLSIAGVVLDPRGEPIELAEVRLESDTTALRGLGEHAYSDDAGSFRFGPLLAGSYRLEARDRRRPFHAASTPLTVEAGSEALVLRLRRAGTLVCSFVGLPVDEEPQVLVRLEEPGSPFQDDLAHLAPGTYSVHAWTESGLVGLLRGFRIEAERENQARVVLAPGAEVSLAENERTPRRLTCFLDGQPYPWTLDRPLSSGFLWVPPGQLVVEGRDWRSDGTLELVGTRTRGLVAGDRWRIDFAE